MNSKKLFDILPEKIILEHIKGNENPTINRLMYDSRQVEEFDLFFAIQGESADGHNFIDKVIEKGCQVIVLEKMPNEIFENINYIQVENSRTALAEIANLFYNTPSKELSLIGITGTNGKTTVATLLYQLFQSMDLKVGLISTVKYCYPGFSESASHTTPDPIRLNGLLRKMIEAGCEYVFMEVSSHAIDQGRIDGVSFAGGVFTNITHDHLDYHETFKNYLNTKKHFFDSLSKSAFVIYNEDDKNGSVMVQNCQAKKIGYSLHQMAEIKGKLLSNSIEGLQMQINQEEIFTRMVGKYNAYNVLAAYGTALNLEIEKHKILVGLSMVKGAEGRFELIVGKKKKVFGVVDYAHTPDALENILSTLNELKNSEQEIITVFGCGGDRDVSKRPKMGLVGHTLSDKTIITNDNPRTEDPELILDQIEKGITVNKDSLIRISDRSQAIKTAVMLSKNGDIILIAGKGHEKYQDINGIKHPFDDKEELEKILL